ncbi:hypothetical protein NC651_027946 [Populus alba x Populus x berolinensis]|nr:hypothetical protein NC651_027946 [Populus alba x Populus x berolinensis]
MARFKTPGNIITVYGCINNDNSTITPTQRPKLQRSSTTAQYTTQSELNFVSTNTRQLHTSQQNWKLKHTLFSTRSPSPSFQKLIKLPIFTKTPKSPNPYNNPLNHQDPSSQS